MNVKELIEKLEKIDPALEVIIKKDGWLNAYSPLARLDSDGIYIADCARTGEVYDRGWSASDIGFKEDEWEEIKKTNSRCLVLYTAD